MSRQKVNSNVVDLDNPTNQLVLTFVKYSTYSTTPAMVKCTCFSSASSTFIKIYHILGLKTSFSKFKRIKVMQSMFSNYVEIKL